MVIATMQRDAVAANLTAYRARYPNPIRHHRHMMKMAMTNTWINWNKWNRRRETFYIMDRH
eukprot:1935370-Amphidinium_carterae.1